MFRDTVIAALVFVPFRFSSCLLMQSSQCTHVVLHYCEPKNLVQPLKVILPAISIAVGLGGLSLSSCLITIATYLLTLAISVTVYRLSPFHPLAQYPGPVLNKITKLAGMQNSWGGHGHRNNHQLHAKYGPVVRVGELARSKHH